MCQLHYLLGLLNFLARLQYAMQVIVDVLG